MKNPHGLASGSNDKVWVISDEGVRKVTRTGAIRTVIDSGRLNGAFRPVYDAIRRPFGRSALYQA